MARPLSQHVRPLGQLAVQRCRRDLRSRDPRSRFVRYPPLLAGLAAQLDVRRRVGPAFVEGKDPIEGDALARAAVDAAATVTAPHGEAHDLGCRRQRRDRHVLAEDGRTRLRHRFGPLPAVEIRLEDDRPDVLRTTGPCRPTRSGPGTTTSAGRPASQRGSGDPTAISRYGRTAARSTRGGASTSGGGTTSHGERNRAAPCAARERSTAVASRRGRRAWPANRRRVAAISRSSERARLSRSSPRPMLPVARSISARTRSISASASAATPTSHSTRRISSRAWVTRRRRFAARRPASATSSCSMKADLSSTSISAPSVRGASEGTTLSAGASERAAPERAGTDRCTRGTAGRDQVEQHALGFVAVGNRIGAVGEE